MLVTVLIFMIWYVLVSSAAVYAPCIQLCHIHLCMTPPFAFCAGCELVQQLSDAIVAASRHLLAQLAMSFFMPFCLTCLSLVARLHALSCQWFLDAVAAYNVLVDLLPALPVLEGIQCYETPLAVAVRHEAALWVQESLDALNPSAGRQPILKDGSRGEKDDSSVRELPLLARSWEKDLPQLLTCEWVQRLPRLVRVPFSDDGVVAKKSAEIGEQYAVMQAIRRADLAVQRAAQQPAVAAAPQSTAPRSTPAIDSCSIGHSRRAADAFGSGTLLPLASSRTQNPNPLVLDITQSPPPQTALDASAVAEPAVPAAAIVVHDSIDIDTAAAAVPRVNVAEVKATCSESSPADGTGDHASLATQLLYPSSGAQAAALDKPKSNAGSAFQVLDVIAGGSKARRRKQRCSSQRSEAADGPASSSAAAALAVFEDKGGEAPTLVVKASALAATTARNLALGLGLRPAVTAGDADAAGLAPKASASRSKRRMQEAFAASDLKAPQVLGCESGKICSVQLHLLRLCLLLFM